ELAEGLAGPGDHPRRVHVARHHEEGVAGNVVAVVEGAQLGRVDAFDVAHPSDHRPAIGMRLVGGGEELLREIAVGVVLDATAPLRARAHWISAGWRSGWRTRRARPRSAGWGRSVAILS